MSEAKTHAFCVLICWSLFSLEGKVLRGTFLSSKSLVQKSVHCNGNVLTIFWLQASMASLFSTPLFLLEDQVLLFVSVYDIFLLPAVVRNSIGAMCHAMVMSQILAPSQPGPPPSLPQGYTLSLHLTFQINLLYCILCLEHLLSTSFQPCKL